MQIKKQEYWENRLERLKAENRDIKEKQASLKRENNSLKKSLRNKNDLFNSIPAGIVLVQQGKILDINKVALDQMGYRADEILGRDFLDLVHPDVKAYVGNLYERRVSGKRAPNEYETDLVTKKGETVGFDIRVNKIRFNGRNAFLATLTRFEKRKRKEKELIRSKKKEALMTVASGLASKFSPSLESILENTGKIRSVDDPENNALMENLKNIDFATGDIINTTRKLDGLARTKNKRSDTTLFDLRKIVRDAIELTGPELKDETERGGMKINVKTYLRSVSPIEGDPVEMQEVIVAMILNAVDAMPKGGDLYLTTEENAGYAHIYIQDNGVGIPDHLGERIFDPFFTTKGKDGIGLGLSLSYAAINRHHGEIEISSKEDQGTIITIRLPCVSQDRKSKAGSARRKINNAHILIIEEEDMLRQLLSQLLGSKGCRVVSALSGLEGLNKLKKKKFDMVIADSGTPGAKGKAFVQRIRKINRDLSVALITEHETRDKTSLSEELGADLIISKPIDMNKVVNRIGEVLMAKAGH